LSLTKIQYSTKTNAGTHVQGQTNFLEFDLSLTETHQPFEEPMQEHMYNVKLSFFDLT